MSLRHWKTWAALMAVASLTTAAVADREPAVSGASKEMTVWKSPSCGCCGKWIDYLKARGYKITVYDMDDVTPVKRQHRMPEAMWSCHTAVIDGYLVEGHVPEEDIARMVKEKPQIAGLAVPGMVTGSPGMEGPNPRHYDVIAFGSGRTSVFARH